jgi:hypothetical protein
MNAQVINKLEEMGAKSAEVSEAEFFKAERKFASSSRKAELEELNRQLEENLKRIQELRGGIKKIKEEDKVELPEGWIGQEFTKEKLAIHLYGRVNVLQDENGVEISREVPTSDIVKASSVIEYLEAKELAFRIGSCKPESNGKNRVGRGADIYSIKEGELPKSVELKENVTKKKKEGEVVAEIIPAGK